MGTATLRRPVCGLLILGLGALVGCGKPPAMPQKPPAPVTVKAMSVIQRTTPILADFVGQVEAAQQVELRAKVNGILEEIRFTEGALVKRGQLLFIIDAGTYEASLADARARVAEAQAAYARVHQDVVRYKVLVEKGTIPRKQFDDAQAEERKLSASVEAAQAVADQKRLGVRDTLITSPIDGRIGRAEIKVGGLVSPGQTLLATVSTLDPMQVSFTLSENEYLTLARRRIEQQSQGLSEGERTVRLALTDGSEYPYPGTVNFIDRAVSASTGALTIRAEFPNPDNLLRPGLYARVRAQIDERKDALLIPQQAVQEMLGKTLITVVGEDGLAQIRPVRMGPRVGALWIVEQGLKPGEQVVVDGAQKARPGMPLHLIPVGEADFGG